MTPSTYLFTILYIVRSILSIIYGLGGNFCTSSSPACAHNILSFVCGRMRPRLSKRARAAENTEGCRCIWAEGAAIFQPFKEFTKRDILSMASESWDMDAA